MSGGNLLLREMAEILLFPCKSFMGLSLTFENIVTLRKPSHAS